MRSHERYIEATEGMLGVCRYEQKGLTGDRFLPKYLL